MTAASCENHGIGHYWSNNQRIDGGSGNTGYGFDTFENIVSHCPHLVLLATERCQVDGNIYGQYLEQAPLRIHRPTYYLDLKNWRKNLGFDKNGRYADITYQLEENDSALTLTIDGKSFQIDFSADLVPQIDGILEAL